MQKVQSNCFNRGGARDIDKSKLENDHRANDSFVDCLKGDSRKRCH